MLIRDLDDPNSLYVSGNTLQSGLGNEVFYAKFDDQGFLKNYFQQGCQLQDKAVSLSLDRLKTSLFALGHSNCYITGQTHLMITKLNEQLAVTWSMSLGITGLN